MQKENNKKEIIISALSVLILIIAVFGISYAVWQQSFSGNEENSINTGYISFSYTESDSNVISITNAVPISDVQGKKLVNNNEMFDFNVSAKYAGVESILYEIYMTPIVETLGQEYVKVYLTDQKDNAIEGFEEVPTYSELEDSEIEGSKTLLKGELTKSGESKDYRVRVWIKDGFNSEENGQKFSFKVNVKGMA